ncbi:hypothetical protein H072_6279 [Dactylellina haptotyla CBS 200.50]|uniref:RNase III domain-containing protein n=1 Tax=Dactylellina haptotyla (strain CBS 200.50) TaxID=1284197 RepID=S8BKP7_DACHA|nr:hypothetical protein H072_6279 [Dactylellina haptotyla CBS 200.50]
MASVRSSLRPILSTARPSRTICSQCRSSLRHDNINIAPTNHQRPLHTSPPKSISSSIPLAINRPLQQVQQQPAPPQMATPPPGYRLNKITRPYVPVSTHQRVPFAVNESLEVLDEMYRKLLGEGGDKALTDEVKWQCVTHKSFDHGLQPYNTKLTFYGRRIAYLHTTLSIIHKPATQSTSDTSFKTQSSEQAVTNDPSLSLNVIARGNPINRVSSGSIAWQLNNTNMFGVAQACGLVKCLRWKPRNPTNLTDSGVQKVAEDTIMAIVGAVALQRGGDAARRLMEDRILPGARVVNQGGETR